MSKKKDIDRAVTGDQQMVDDISGYEQRIADLTAIAQKTRADFENYRKHVQVDIERAEQNAQQKIINNLLPIIDTIEMATGNIPDDLADNEWTRGVVAMQKNVDKLLADLGVEKIPASVGDKFDHNIHEAVVFNPDIEGGEEKIAAILRPGYTYHGNLLRPVMVQVS